jgi:hypothetical protein
MMKEASDRMGLHKLLKKLVDILIEPESKLKIEYFVIFFSICKCIFTHLFLKKIERGGRKAMNRKRLTMLCLLLILVWVSGCATTDTSKKPYRLSEQGMLIWNDEYEFMVPPVGWKVIQVESGGEFGFGFLHSDPGPFPSQSMFVYDEEPFGCSLNFEERGEEFFKRYLWSASISMNIKILERKKISVVGGEGLAVIAEGQDSVKKEKVPRLRGAVLVEGLPGIGNVGRVAASYLANEMKMEKIAELEKRGRTST